MFTAKEWVDIRLKAATKNSSLTIMNFDQKIGRLI
jgi:hypothetical protein